jgi:predicted signal transduction protein with EAL and GGDEF domain
MTRKGRLQEIFSKALYADNPDLYSVSYRDFSSVVEVPLLDFINMSENFELIPSNRVLLVKKERQVLYRKFGVTSI